MTNEPSQEPKLIDTEISSENIALNTIVAFLNLAQRRGAFNLAESSKLWECVTKFQTKK
jgi:hypothetical protein